jgi:hypothetical protein
MRRRRRRRRRGSRVWRSLPRSMAIYTMSDVGLTRQRWLYLVLWMRTGPGRSTKKETNGD